MRAAAVAYPVTAPDEKLVAVAPLSLRWNYEGTTGRPEYFDAYGIAPDPVRIGYCRALWDAEHLPRCPTPDLRASARHRSPVTLADNHETSEEDC